MRFLIIILAAVLFVVNANKGYTYIPNSADPDKPGFCLHKELKVSIKENDTVQANRDECVSYLCLPDGLILVQDCPAYPTHCKFVPADLSKPFPDCCATAKCN